MNAPEEVVIEVGQVYETPIGRTIEIAKVEGKVIYGITSWTSPQWYEMDEVKDLINSGKWMLKAS